MLIEQTIKVNTNYVRIRDLSQSDLIVVGENLARFDHWFSYTGQTGPNAGKTWCVLVTTLGDEFHFDGPDAKVCGVALTKYQG